MATSDQDSRLNFRLPANLKHTIEEAAAQLGQSVSDFAVSTLVEKARQVIDDHHATVLSDRDRQRFAKILDDRSAKPNRTLAAAAKRYREQGR